MHASGSALGGRRRDRIGPVRRQAPPRDRLDPRSDALTLATLALVAFAIRLVPVLRGGGLLGLEGYDDGVYFSAAIAAVHGILPYRDVLLLHPPGIVVGLAPFALLGRLIGDTDAFAIARLAFMTMGAVNAVLVAVVAGRYDRRARLAAGLLYAVWITAANVERNTDFHGPQSMLVLVALLILAGPGRIGARRALLAGAVVGLATSIELWQGVTVLVLLWWVAVRARGDGGARVRPPLAYGAGAATTFAVVCAPFLIAAPGAMVQDVLLDQVSRPNAGIGVVERLRILEGVPRLLGHPALTVFVGPGIVVAGLVGLGLVIVTAWRRPWARPWAVLAGAQTAVVLTTPSFHADYPSFMVAAGSLVIGTGLAMLGRSVRRFGGPSPVAIAPIAALFVGMAVVSGDRSIGVRVPLAAIDRDLAGARCVSADSPAILVLTSTIERDLEAHCPLVVDPTGVMLGGRERLTSPVYQHAMVAWYTSGTAALFANPSGDGLTTTTKAVIASRLPIRVLDGPVTVRLALLR